MTLTWKELKMRAVHATPRIKEMRKVGKKWLSWEVILALGSEK